MKRLKNHYACWGLFHDWDEARADFQRRAVLEIRAGKPSVLAPLPPEMLAEQPEALVVMMNPGSSAPKPGFGSREHEFQLVPTKPDAVQYRIMRVMEAVGLTHVRVVNLSDVRAARSADLFALISNGATHADLGCVFAEANAAIGTDVLGAPLVICAWGLDKRLASLAFEAQAWVDAQGVATAGCRSDEETGFPAWRYPKPVRNWELARAWLESVTEQLLALYASTSNPAQS
ncbi:Protein of unknown function [Myxococcus fulvus]|uniref:DUF1643 domain-containing protein n=1 Tax=Myxococcus fulvus TaxID=33 RepID=A0A511T9K5_MYXFU|nr:DUF1643 domain-containing protein [Myxococcus fulvus]GEN10861.1 hypothetical protein MFU01_58980 [Myxococcus fulvus]SEU37409.1 Protein of unknown function [Myxococcus fulvus]